MGRLSRSVCGEMVQRGLCHARAHDTKDRTVVFMHLQKVYFILESSIQAIGEQSEMLY